MIIPANPGWFYILKENKVPVIAWLFEQFSDESWSHPMPIGPWGAEKLMTYALVSPEGREYAVDLAGVEHDDLVE